MKRLIGVLLAVLCLVGLPITAYSHELVTDGTIGAVMHIEPDDNPASGRPVTIEFEFTDTGKHFSLPDCDCFLAVEKDGKPTSKVSLGHGQSFLNAKLDYTFPKGGVYQLEVSGSAKTAGNFQNFKLAYTVRATGEAATSNHFPRLLWWGIGGGVALILLAGYAQNVLYARKHKKR